MEVLFKNALLPNSKSKGPMSSCLKTAAHNAEPTSPRESGPASQETHTKFATLPRIEIGGEVIGGEVGV